LEGHVWSGSINHFGILIRGEILRFVLLLFPFNHWTSTAQEERVVMIVLGFTITLNRFGKVR